MKVLHTIGSLTGGGAEKQCKLLMEHHCSLGHEIGVIYFHDKPQIKKNPDINYYQISRGHRFSFYKLFTQINEIIFKVKPDIVHNWLPEIITIPATIISNWQKIPNISSQRRVLQRNADFTDRLRDYFIPLNHLIANKVVCNFDFSSEKTLVKRIINYKDGITIPNGFEFISSTNKKRFSFLKQDSLKLLFAGRLVMQKNVDILIRSVAHLKNKGLDVQLVILGEGKLKEMLQDLSYSLGLTNGEIQFVGYIPDWHNYAHSFDIFVFPTNAEGMPNVLIEAMNLQIPTITNNIPEISSIFNHGEETHLIDDIDYFKLSDAIELICNDSDYRHKLVFSAAKKIKEFSVECMAGRFMACYESLLYESKR